MPSTHPSRRNFWPSFPGLRGVGGSLLRLVAASGAAPLWTSDFRPLDRSAGEAATGDSPAFTGFDHIAQTMPYDEMLSWALFYTSLFDARNAPVVDVADPDGLVRSQAIRTGGFRVTLNGADARRTLAGRFMTETFGAATQHIAFVCNDIFAAAAGLAERGFVPLPIGANYYDDLEARFDLVADLTAISRDAEARTGR